MKITRATIGVNAAGVISRLYGDSDPPTSVMTSSYRPLSSSVGCNATSCITSWILCTNNKFIFVVETAPSFANVDWKTRTYDKGQDESAVLRLKKEIKKKKKKIQ